MNFKDAYKSMNDEIHGNRALMNKIINGETKEKKKFTFRFKPGYSLAIAAAFAVCIMTLYNNVGFKDYSSTSDRFDNVTMKTDNGESTVQDSNEPIEVAPQLENETTNEIVPTSDTASNEAVKAYSEPKNSDSTLADDDVQTVGEPAPASETFDYLTAADSDFAVVDSSVIDSTDSAEVYDDVAESNESAQLEVGISASGGGASFGTKSMSMDPALVPPESIQETVKIIPSGEIAYPTGNTDDTKQVSISQYWQYIGVEMISVIDTPDDLDLSQSCPENVYLDEEQNDDILVLNASADNNRSVYAAFSKNESLKSDYPHALIIKHGDVYVALTADGLTNEEASILVESLK